jgi:hypothetical protein
LLCVPLESDWQGQFTQFATDDRAHGERAQVARRRCLAAIATRSGDIESAHRDPRLASSERTHTLGLVRPDRRDSGLPERPLPSTMTGYFRNTTTTGRYTINEAAPERTASSLSELASTGSHRPFTLPAGDNHHPLPASIRDAGVGARAPGTPLSARASLGRGAEEGEPADRDLGGHGLVKLSDLPRGVSWFGVRLEDRRVHYGLHPTSTWPACPYCRWLSSVELASGA